MCVCVYIYMYPCLDAGWNAEVFRKFVHVLLGCQSSIPAQRTLLLMRNTGQTPQLGSGLPCWRHGIPEEWRGPVYRKNPSACRAKEKFNGGKMVFTRGRNGASWSLWPVCWSVPQDAGGWGVHPLTDGKLKKRRWHATVWLFSSDNCDIW